MIEQLMDQFAGFAANWLSLVLLATWRTLPIFVIVAGIVLACRQKLSPSLCALLLTLVLARLLLPVSIGSPVSLQNPMGNWFPIASEATGHLLHPTSASESGPVLLPPVEQAAVPTSWEINDGHPLRASFSGSFSWGEVLWTAVLFVGVAVSMGLILRNVLSHLRFALQLRTCPLLDHQPLVDLLLRECDSMAVGRRPAVREVNLLSAPAVFGIFRQTICFPPNLLANLNEQELRWVIRHELAHIRRRDIPVMILASFARAFHWFNPIVWLVVNHLRAAMEAAADRLALKSLAPSEVSGYGNLLVRLAQNGSAATKPPTLGLISITSSGRQLQLRIEQLLRHRNAMGTVGRCLVTCLVAALAVAGLTDADQTKKMPALNFFNEQISAEIQHASAAPLLATESDAPTTVEEYDLKSIFETMPKSLTGSSLSQVEQLASWLQLPPELAGRLRVEDNTLAANLTARQHESLKQTLEVWKHGEPKQIVIEARVFKTDIDTAASIDWASQRIDGLTVKGLGPALAARIEAADLARLVQTIKADPKASVSQSPTVRLFDGQTAGIFSGSERPFVTGADPKADGTVQPVVSIVQEGLRFSFTPKAGDDGSISLAFSVTSASIESVSYANLPIRDLARQESGFTVQVPATEQYEISSTVEVDAGESIVVAIPRVFKHEPGADAESTLIVALTPQIIEKGETPVQAVHKQ
jgi:beta-lactamase regulating signal transducer with metallopeptidase domain